jgi:hypothetical protein
MRYLLSSGISENPYEYVKDSLSLLFKCDKGAVPSNKSYGLNKYVEGLSIEDASEIITQRLQDIVKDYNIRNGFDLSISDIKLSNDSIKIIINIGEIEQQYEIPR